MKIENSTPEEEAQMRIEHAIWKLKDSLHMIKISLAEAAKTIPHESSKEVVNSFGTLLFHLKYIDPSIQGETLEEYIIKNYKEVKHESN